MVNHNSKKANVNYRIAHILWFLSIAVLPIVICHIILLAIPVLLMSLFLRVMGTVAYLSGNDENTNRSDLKRRALKMQNMSRFYWVLAPLCLLIRRGRAMVYLWYSRCNGADLRNIYNNHKAKHHKTTPPPKASQKYTSKT